MDNLFIIFSLLGFANSLFLATFLFMTKKGSRKSNVLFGLLVLAISIRIGKSILFFSFSKNIANLVLIVGLSSFLLIGPFLLLFVHSITNPKWKWELGSMIHFAPAVGFFLAFSFLPYRQIDQPLRHFVYSLLLLQNITYLLYVSNYIDRLKTLNSYLKKQLSWIALATFIVWLTYFLNSVSDWFHYLHGGLIYTVIVYFSFLLLVNRGEVVAPKKMVKYEKSGLKSDDIQKIIKKLEQPEAKAFLIDPTISQGKLAKHLNVSPNALSQAINTHYQQSFFNYISTHRIELVKERLLDPKNQQNVSDIAFEVGFNSLSAFYNAFKKTESCTPREFIKRNEK